MKWLKRVAMVVAALILLPVAALLVLDFRPGAGTMHASVDIQAPPEQIWQWIDDGSRLKQWVSWTEDVKPWSPQPGVGAKRSMTMRDENNGGALMVIDSECTVYAPPKMVVVKLNVPAVFEGRDSYRLTDLGAGNTRLDLDGSDHFDSPFARLMEPLITMAARKKMEADLAHLKMLVETKAELR